MLKLDDYLIDRASPQAQGLLACLPDCLTDVSGKGNNGVVAAGSPLLVSTPWGIGRAFNGTSYVNVGVRQDLNLKSSFCLSAWIKSSSTGTNAVLMNDNGFGGYGWAYAWLMGALGPGHLSLFIQNGSSQQTVTGSNTLPSTGWHHIAAVHSGGYTQLYMDGKPDGSAQAQFDPIYSTNEQGFLIGAVTGGSFLFAGNIADVRVSSALPPAVIADIAHNPNNLYNRRHSHPDESMIARYKSRIERRID